MAETPFTRRDFAATAAVTTLSEGINASAETITIGSGTGWPTGSNGHFFILIDDEVIGCSARSGTTLTVSTRGAEGTSAASHTANTSVALVHGKTDLDEANYAVAQTVGKVTASQDLLVASGANAFARLAKGSNGNVLVMSGGNVTWGALPADSVGSSQIAADAVGSSEIAADAVGVSELNSTALQVQVPFSKSGTLSAAAGTHRWYPPWDCTIVGVTAAVGTAPTGQALIVDVNNSGTTIFSTQGNRPQIAAGTNFDAASTADGDTTLTSGTDYVTVDIDQVGSSVAGSDLTVIVLVERTA